MKPELLLLFSILSVLLSVSLAEDKCTNSTCALPFSHCADISGDCEAIKRASGSNDFLPSPYKITWDQQVDVACSEDGNYPFSDCQSFYHCHNGVATLRTCDSPGYPYFNPVLQRCTNNADCPHFDCFNKAGLRVGLKGKLSSFFAYCFRTEMFYTLSIAQDANIHLISRCYGKDLFDSNKGRCAPRCVQEGLIPDTSDCHSYFLCSLQDAVNVEFKMTKLSCPKGQGYLTGEFRCAPEADVPSCSRVLSKHI